MSNRVYRRDIEVVEAVPTIVEAILTEGYYRKESSMSGSLEASKGNCAAFMKWGGTVLRALDFAGEWLHAVRIDGIDFLDRVSHCALLIPSLFASFDSSSRLLFPVNGFHCDTIQELIRLTKQGGLVYRSQGISIQPQSWCGCGNCSPESPVNNDCYCELYNNLFTSSQIAYPQFAVDKVLEVVANDPELSHLLPTA